MSHQKEVYSNRDSEHGLKIYPRDENDYRKKLESNKEFLKKQIQDKEMKKARLAKEKL